MNRRVRAQDSGARSRIAAEAARLVVEDQLESLSAAARKAAARLGLDARQQLPSQREVEQAVIEYQRLFGGEAREEALTGLRRNAVEAMRVLGNYRPRLVGPVLSGTAGPDSRITLHVFTDTPEDVGFALEEAGIPARLGSARLHDFQGTGRDYPRYGFIAGRRQIEAIVFPEQQFRHAPPDPVDGRPMARADIEAVRRLLSGDE